MKTKKGATLVGTLIAIAILTSTLVVTLNLQVRIMRARFFLQYDNTANLLMAEGLEIVRAIYDTPGYTLPNGKYELDFNSVSLTDVSTCTESGLNSTCDLGDPNYLIGYRRIPTTETRVFHRFVTVSNSGTVPSVTSTVVVKNPKGGALKVYKATIRLYKIN